MTKEQLFLQIHTALHTEGLQSLMIGGLKVPITLAANGCRQVYLNDLLTGNCRIVVQNEKKNSPHALRSRNGENLTWVMPLNEQGLPISGWLLIDIPVTERAKEIAEAK